MAHIWPAYDGGIGRVLPGVAAVVAALYVLSAVISPMDRPGPQGVAISVLAAFCALVAGSVAWITREESARRRRSQQAILGMTLAIVGASCLQMMITVDPRQTTSVVISIFGLGASLLSRRYLIAGTLMSWAMWVGAALALPSGTWSSYWFFVMAASTAIAVGAFIARLNSFEALDVALTTAERLSGEDPLTGLANRRGALIAGERLVAEARRSNEGVTCLFIDVDGLKSVNDEVDHEAGDEVLRTVAAGLLEVFRAGDILARWGGDEFVVFTRGPGPSAIDTERRMQARLTELTSLSDDVWRPFVSVGAATMGPWQDMTAKDLSNMADQDMIARRTARRGSSMTADLRDRDRGRDPRASDRGGRDYPEHYGFRADSGPGSGAGDAGPGPVYPSDPSYPPSSGRPAGPPPGRHRGAPEFPAPPVGEPWPDPRAHNSPYLPPARGQWPNTDDLPPARA